MLNFFFDNIISIFCHPIEKSLISNEVLKILNNDSDRKILNEGIEALKISNKPQKLHLSTGDIVITT